MFIVTGIENNMLNVLDTRDNVTEALSLDTVLDIIEKYDNIKISNVTVYPRYVEVFIDNKAPNILFRDNTVFGVDYSKYLKPFKGIYFYKLHNKDNDRYQRMQGILSYYPSSAVTKGRLNLNKNELYTGNFDKNCVFGLSSIASVVLKCSKDDCELPDELISNGINKSKTSFQDYFTILDKDGEYYNVQKGYALSSRDRRISHGVEYDRLGVLELYSVYKRLQGRNIVSIFNLLFHNSGKFVPQMAVVGNLFIIRTLKTCYAYNAVALENAFTNGVKVNARNALFGVDTLQPKSFLIDENKNLLSYVVDYSYARLHMDENVKLRDTFRIENVNCLLSKSISLSYISTICNIIIDKSVRDIKPDFVDRTEYLKQSSKGKNKYMAKYYNFVYQYDSANCISGLVASLVEENLYSIILNKEFHKTVMLACNLLKSSDIFLSGSIYFDYDKTKTPCDECYAYMCSEQQVDYDIVRKIILRSLDFRVMDNRDIVIDEPVTRGANRIYEAVEEWVSNPDNRLNNRLLAYIALENKLKSIKGLYKFFSIVRKGALRDCKVLNDYFIQMYKDKFLPMLDYYFDTIMPEVIFQEYL